MMKFLSVAIAAALLSTSAMAQDWTGAYGGLQIGKADSNDAGIFALPSGNASLDAAFADRGFSGGFESNEIGGIHAGYDWQKGNFVMGVVGDLNLGKVRDEQRGFSRTPADYIISREMNEYVTLRGRLGFLATDNVLVYGTAGVSYGDVEFGYSQAGSGATTTTSGGQNDKLGKVLGFGVETKVSEKLSIGLEYLHVDMGGNDFAATLAGGPFSAVTPTTTATGSDRDFDFGTVQLKASYRF